MTASEKQSKQLKKRESVPQSDPAFLQELKLYRRIARDILVRQEREDWGVKVIDRLRVADLKKAFSGMKGFCPRNLKYMGAFAEAWPQEEFVEQAVAQMPRVHNVPESELEGTDDEQ